MKIYTFLLALSLFGYAYIGYGMSRADFIPFALVYTALFAVFFLAYKYLNRDYFNKNWKLFLAGGLLLRVVFLVATPELSDDFWRYFWDGRLLSFGINPYEFIPSELVAEPIFKQAALEQLYPHLNSPNYYSVYPPLIQLLFAGINYFFSNTVLGGLVVMHLLILLFEGLTMFFLVKILDFLERPRFTAFLYVFNPLVIIELSGNLHSEVFAITTLVMAMYFLLKRNLTISAVLFSFSVGFKLLPLMFLPIILNRLWFRDGFFYCTIVGSLTLAYFALFFDLELIKKIQKGLGLYFGHFEFNASIYYVLRYWVFEEYWKLWDYHEYFMHNTRIENMLRWDWYAIIRKVLPVFSLIGILLLSINRIVRLFDREFFLRCLCLYTVYILFANTIHPWYILFLLPFAVITGVKFPIVWTFLIGFTYISYANNGFMENSWIIGIEYVVVFATMFFEYYNRMKNTKGVY